MFTLVGDNFGVKYVAIENCNHLISALRDLYTVTTDLIGKKYLGIALQWNYEKNYVDISIPGYVAKALHRF